MLTKTIKKKIQGAIGQETLGALDYYRFPHLKSEWGGPLNNQSFRQKIFRDLIRTFAFTKIVETGTYRGTTTEFFATVSGLPVFTVELQPRFYGYARTRLRRFKSIHTSQGDSRAFLDALSARDRDTNSEVFFYLDAHWRRKDSTLDLPLREEIETIFRVWPRAVVMIDDFEVPGDDGYRYDDYGPGNVLCLDYLEPLEHFGLAKYFPAAPSGEESGLKRGCIVLGRASDVIGKLDTVETLKRLRVAPSRQP